MEKLMEVVVCAKSKQAPKNKSSPNAWCKRIKWNDFLGLFSYFFVWVISTIRELACSKILHFVIFDMLKWFSSLF